MKEIAVIGAGASGLAATVECMRYLAENRFSARVVLYESQPRVGKKILATGNGRCNLLNSDGDISAFNGDRAFIESILSTFGVESDREFFSSMGLETFVQEAGRIYPLSRQASGVLDALRFEVQRLGIKTVCDTKITSLKKTDGKFILNGIFDADAVIIAGGGKSSPAHGSDGSCLELISSLGIKTRKAVPALVPIVLKTPSKALKGIRAFGKITVTDGKSVLASSSGEIQFTEYGLSGIPAMDVSYAASRASDNGKKVFAEVELIENMSEADIVSYLTKRREINPLLAVGEVFGGIMNKQLGMYKLSVCGISPSAEIGSIGNRDIRILSQCIKKQTSEIKGVRPFAESQVTSGGVLLSEFSNGLECGKISGLFACGELLDVDAKCGGYNLTWAWSSGRTAGLSAAKYIIGEKQCSE